MSRAVLLLALAGLVVSGCGGDDDDDGAAGSAGSFGQSGTGGLGGLGGMSGTAAGSGGSAGSAGSAGSSGKGGSGGSAGMDDMDGGTCTPNEPADISSALPKCSPAVCPAQDSVCVPSGAITDPDVVAALADCDGADEGKKCVPNLLVDTSNKFLLKTCRSLNDSEGRCLSTCIPQVAQQASQLPQDTCPDGELCAPCYDPRTGEMTAACTQGCDPGPTEAPKPFPECCGGVGVCVTAALAGDQASSLVADSCTGDGELCAPRNLTDPTYRPPSCRSVNDAEGRCLSVCVATVAQQLDQLPTATCADDERCAPCYDPRTGDDTGACKVNGDSPVEPPKTFTECCSTRGYCVTEGQAGDQAGSLVADSCTGGLLCAPKELTDPSFVPVTCDSIDMREGRCLSTCVGSVQKQLAQLPTAGCQANEACAPCYDPITDENTGACEINGDMPAEHEAPFDRCCDNGQGTKVGVCVPPELAGDQADILKQDTCSSGDLCAPIVKAQDPSYKFPKCTVGGIAGFICGGCQGACVPSCILDSSQAGLLTKTNTCKTGELCAPCVDPLSGDSTGACD